MTFMLQLLVMTLQSPALRESFIKYRPSYYEKRNSFINEKIFSNKQLALIISLILESCSQAGRTEC